MEDDAAAEILSARRKLRQSPIKISYLGLISWKEALLKPNAIGSRRGMLEQIENKCRKDDQTRSKELRRVRETFRERGKKFRVCRIGWTICGTKLDISKSRRKMRESRGKPYGDYRLISSTELRSHVVGRKSVHYRSSSFRLKGV